MLGDTIHAVASPQGSAARAVLRLSGPLARAAAASVFAPALPERRCQLEGAVSVCGGRLPALALCMPAPRSYTGEDVVELHVAGGAVLLGELQRAMAAAIGPALRPARPGEFTARACCNGRIDLLQAEGVLLLIHGADAAATAAGAAWLGGGLTGAVARARSGLQDALALLELGLDFDDGEAGSVDEAQWRAILLRAADEIAALQRSLPLAARGGEVLLLGASNVGKSSLCNALAGRDAVLVDAAPGTTRDLLRVELGEGSAVGGPAPGGPAPGGPAPGSPAPGSPTSGCPTLGCTAVWDAPGDLDQPSVVDRCALQLRDRLGAQAAAAVLVLDAATPAPVAASPLPLLAAVFSKADRWPDAPSARAAAASAAARLRLPADLPCFVVSAHSGLGVDALRRFLVEHGSIGARDAGAPVRLALDRAAVAAARVLAAGGIAHELASVDLHEALQALGEIDGSHGPEDLLDRIYARFCLGK